MHEKRWLRCCLRLLHIVNFWNFSTLGPYNSKTGGRTTKFFLLNLLRVVKNDLVKTFFCLIFFNYPSQKLSSYTISRKISEGHRSSFFPKRLQVVKSVIKKRYGQSGHGTSWYDPTKLFIYWTWYTLNFYG